MSSNKLTATIGKCVEKFKKAPSTNFVLTSVFTLYFHIECLNKPLTGPGTQLLVKLSVKNTYISLLVSST